MNQGKYGNSRRFERKLEKDFYKSLLSLVNNCFVKSQLVSCDMEKVLN